MSTSFRVMRYVRQVHGASMVNKLMSDLHLKTANIRLSELLMSKRKSLKTIKDFLLIVKDFYSVSILQELLCRHHY